MRGLARLGVKNGSLETFRVGAVLGRGELRVQSGKVEENGRTFEDQVGHLLHGI
jgi:hypothetical protein